MRFQSYPDREIMAMDVARLLAETLAERLDHQDRVRFAVCGGTTPGPIFDLLAGTKMDWSRVDLLLSDERWVPQDHPRSNAALVTTRLVTGAAQNANLHPFYRKGPSLEAAMADIETLVASFLPLDIVLLGMGADMHTASLFPDAPEIGAALASDAPPVLALSPPSQEELRISLSAGTIRAAKARHLVITGDEKRAALARAETLEPADAPVRAILEDTDVHWAA